MHGMHGTWGFPFRSMDCFSKCFCLKMFLPNVSWALFLDVFWKKQPHHSSLSYSLKSLILVYKEIFKSWNGNSKSLKMCVTGSPGPIQNLRDIKNDDGSITLEWLPPFNKAGTNIRYIVKYGDQTGTTTTTTFDIPTGTEDMMYTVEVSSTTSLFSCLTWTDLWNLYFSKEYHPLSRIISNE